MHRKGPWAKTGGNVLAFFLFNSLFLANYYYNLPLYLIYLILTGLSVGLFLLAWYLKWFNQFYCVWLYALIIIELYWSLSFLPLTFLSFGTILMVVYWLMLNFKKLNIILACFLISALLISGLIGF